MTGTRPDSAEEHGKEHCSDDRDRQAASRATARAIALSRFLVRIGSTFGAGDGVPMAVIREAASAQAGWAAIGDLPDIGSSAPMTAPQKTQVAASRVPTMPRTLPRLACMSLGSAGACRPPVRPRPVLVLTQRPRRSATGV
jgi:hypothetical protein